MRVSKHGLFFVLFELAAFFGWAQNKPDPTRRLDSTSLKTDTLRAAIVTALLRPRIKADTLEFNTDHYKVYRNEGIEEMLRRLPGLQIDANGAITYNGQSIEHLLVDGEDVFGSDPSLVTRNYDASKISRVQIIDRKSEQSIFTGLDDGSRTKTINLVMKESAKNGYFGKVEIGGNTGGDGGSSVAAAAFRDKEQFTVLGFTSNTGILGFSNSAGASVGFFNAMSDGLGASAGIGIPRFEATALHYANIWDNHNDHVAANYQYSNYHTNPLANTTSLDFEPNGVYRQTTTGESWNQQRQHWGYGGLDLGQVGKSTLKVTVRASDSRGTNRLSSGAMETFNDTLLNKSNRSINDQVSQSNLGGELALRIQVGKRAERLLSITMGATKYGNQTSGYLRSINEFYNHGGSMLLIDTIAQRKQLSLGSFNATGSLNFAEPIWKDATVGISYWAAMLLSKPVQLTFDRGDGKYQVLIDSLSTKLKTQLTREKTTLSMQGKSGRFIYALVGDLFVYTYCQHDYMSDSSLRVQYLNWMPRILLSYLLSQRSSISGSYTSTAQQPAENQIEPSRNNSDPLRVWIGNPNLRPSVIENIGVEGRYISNWVISLRANVGFVRNSISNKSIIDSLGRQVSQWVNVDGGRMAGTYVSVNGRILGVDAGIHAGINYSKSVNYLEAQLTRNETYEDESGFSVSKYVSGKYSVELTTQFSYLSQRSSVGSGTSVCYWSQKHQAALTLFLISNFEINTSGVYNWQGKANSFADNSSVLQWNAYVSRSCLHDNLVVRFQLNNMLNANSGITRTNSANISMEATSNVLGRYWMLSVAYHFDRKFKRK